VPEVRIKGRGKINRQDQPVMYGYMEIYQYIPLMCGMKKRIKTQKGKIIYSLLAK
jgi:hypothetical protein